MMSVNMEPDQWQLGRTKVFIKSPESVSIELIVPDCSAGSLNGFIFTLAVSIGRTERKKI